jgi:hypothetical protein
MPPHDLRDRPLQIVVDAGLDQRILGFFAAQAIRQMRQRSSEGLPRRRHGFRQRRDKGLRR